jgi:hypothetical protein
MVSWTLPGSQSVAYTLSADISQNIHAWHVLKIS